jgi:hypothetical protein
MQLSWITYNSILFRVVLVQTNTILMQIIRWNHSVSGVDKIYGNQKRLSTGPCVQFSHLGNSERERVIRMTEYTNFVELAAHETEGEDYLIRIVSRNPGVVILAELEPAHLSWRDISGTIASDIQLFYQLER